VRKAALILAASVLTSACGPPELTAELAQSLLDEELGAGRVEVLTVLPEGEAAAVALVKLPEMEELEVDVSFSFVDPAWQPGEATALGQAFPLARLASAVDLGRQRQTLADMQAIAAANAAMREATGSYAGSLEELHAKGYLEAVPGADGWGNPFDYSGSQSTYQLRSLGSNGKTGPPPPSRWVHEPYDPDLVIQDGMFLQAPVVR